MLAFIEDQPRAIRECVRVAKPGGYVGLNETVWIEESPPERVEQAREWGTSILTAEAWQALWEGSGLQDREVRTYQIDAQVYELYGLTEEEIRVVEGRLKHE
jgi:ubiquinone/menaquinone biosynthesis C-methylase UbiE